MYLAGFGFRLALCYILIFTAMSACLPILSKQKKKIRVVLAFEKNREGDDEFS